MVDPNQPNEDSYEVLIHIIESTSETDEIDDRYAIVCPICGHDEFEDIYVAGKKMLRWARLGEIKFRRSMNKVQSLRCLRCDYILNFAREK